MTALAWEPIARRYESGVEKGVFYPSDGPGVVWNGLLSVVENISTEQTSYAIDGVTYLNSVSPSDYQATVRAFSAPREFAPYVGDLEIAPGISLTRQSRSPFGFSYRTLIGDTGYRIHMVYNATANPTSRSYATTNDTPSPVNLEWQINAVPPTDVSGFRPTPHFFVDSTKIDAATLATLENTLYGTQTADPSLPALIDLVMLIDPQLVTGDA